MDKAMHRKIGSYAFIIGVIIAVLAGLAQGFNTALPEAGIAALLMVFGAAIGFLNIAEKEASPFLIAAIALGMGGGMVGTIKETLVVFFPPLGPILFYVLFYIAALAVPAAVIVALKAFYNLAATPKV